MFWVSICDLWEASLISCSFHVDILFLWFHCWRQLLFLFVGSCLLCLKLVGYMFGVIFEHFLLCCFSVYLSFIYPPSLCVCVYAPSCAFLYVYVHVCACAHTCDSCGTQKTMSRMSWFFSSIVPVLRIRLRSSGLAALLLTVIFPDPWIYIPILCFFDHHNFLVYLEVRP